MLFVCFVLYFASNALPQGHHNWLKENKFQLSLEIKCISLKEVTYQLLRKLPPFIFKSTIVLLQRNASIKRECFPPAQFNEFAAVKQANLVKRSLTKWS